MKRNHHKARFQVYVCGALVFESEDCNTAHAYACAARKNPDDRQVFEKTVYSDSKQFIGVDCSRGAPMGRQPYGIPSDCPKHSIRLFRVNLHGDYDDGGAYWGSGLEAGPLYCARYGNTYRAFTRAKDRIEATGRLRIPEDKLKVRN